MSQPTAPQSTGARMIAAERARQIESESGDAWDLIDPDEPLLVTAGYVSEDPTQIKPSELTSMLCPCGLVVALTMPCCPYCGKNSNQKKP